MYSLGPLFSFLNTKVAISFKMYTLRFPHSHFWKEAIFPSLNSPGHPPPLIPFPLQPLFNFPIISVFAIVFSQCAFCQILEDVSSQLRINSDFLKKFFSVLILIYICVIYWLFYVFSIIQWILWFWCILHI